MIVTVGGSIGSGKSTLARAVSQKFDLVHISAGSVMREMAKERGMSLIEFSRYAENDSSIDKLIDDRQKELAAGGNCVVDGRLSAYMIEADLRIWLDAPLDTRSIRVSEREKIPAGDAKTRILDREGSEKKRYLEIYGIDLDDMKPYDLVINTGKFGIDDMVSLVAMAIKSI